MQLLQLTTRIGFIVLGSRSGSYFKQEWPMDDGEGRLETCVSKLSLRESCAFIDMHLKLAFLK